jgi:hypothetical protein
MLINTRFNEKDLASLRKAGEILKLNPKAYGYNADVIKKSIQFVVEFNHLVMEKFLQDYPPLIRKLVIESQRG